MRVKAYAGFFDGTDFIEVVRVDLGRDEDAGYVYDAYMHPTGEAVVLYTEYGDPITEDKIGNNLRALKVDHVLRAMQDDNAEGIVWTWEMDVLSTSDVTHVILTVW